jgi:hypothetical protein
VRVIGATRGELRPNPKHDAVLVVGMCYTADGGETHNNVALVLRDPPPPKPPPPPPPPPPAPTGRGDPSGGGGGGGGGGAQGGDAGPSPFNADSTPEDGEPHPAAAAAGCLECIVGGGAGAGHRARGGGDRGGVGPDADADEAVDAAWAWGVEDAAPGDDVEVHCFNSEPALLRGFVATLRAIDPDVLVGFEIQGGSLGYIAERAAVLDIGEAVQVEFS